MAEEPVARAERIAGRIVPLRGLRVILDADLARLYAVETRRLNEQVRRNPGRFPPEFVIQLSNQELVQLMSQNATSNGRRGGIRKAPLAFTEHGALMAATVLSSPRAVEVSRKAPPRARTQSGKHDGAIAEILAALRQLMQPPPAARRRIGFL